MVLAGGKSTKFNLRWNLAQEGAVSTRSMEQDNMWCIPLYLQLSVVQIQRKERNWGDWSSCDRLASDQQALFCTQSQHLFVCCTNETLDTHSRVPQRVWPSQSIWSLALRLTAWTVDGKLCKSTFETCTATKTCVDSHTDTGCNNSVLPSQLTHRHQPPVAKKIVAAALTWSDFALARVCWSNLLSKVSDLSLHRATHPRTLLAASHALVTSQPQN